MKCKVQGVYKNPRYRILSIGEEKYILDMGRPFWKNLFPLFYWMYPNKVYEVNNEAMEKIGMSEVEGENTGWQSGLTGVFALILGNLLYPLIHYFNVAITPLISSVCVVIALVFVLTFFMYMNFKSGKKLSKVINLSQFSKKRLWIRPQSYRNFFFVLFSYILTLWLTFMSWGGFIQLANVFILFAGMLFFSLLLLSSFMTVGVGETTVKFKDD